MKLLTTLLSSSPGEQKVVGVIGSKLEVSCVFKEKIQDRLLAGIKKEKID